MICVQKWVKIRIEIYTSNTQTLKQYKCGFCGETFLNKRDFMKHIQHKEYIMSCRDDQNGLCGYGSENCWFKHGDEVEIQLVQAGIQECEPSMMTRLFNMMEEFAQRMNNLENYLF